MDEVRILIHFSQNLLLKKTWIFRITWKNKKAGSPLIMANSQLYSLHSERDSLISVTLVQPGYSAIWLACFCKGIKPYIYPTSLNCMENLESRYTGYQLIWINLSLGHCHCKYNLLKTVGKERQRILSPCAIIPHIDAPGVGWEIHYHLLCPCDKILTSMALTVTVCTKGLEDIVYFIRLFMA